MRVWLLEGHAPDEEHHQAWALDYLGFATWAPSRAKVMAKLPSKLNEYRAWLAAHGFPGRGTDRELEVVETVRGGEVLFKPDRQSASPAEVDLAIRLLGATRSDLLALLRGLPDGVLDWDPPYERFEEWATWRTVRQIAAHVANTETHYYLANIGFEPANEPLTLYGFWQEDLADRRAAVIRFLNDLAESGDRLRVDEAGEWSVRKVLRRLVWHELLHTKSIRRIVGAWERQ